MMRYSITSVVAAALLSGGAGAADWPHFRGPAFDGISRETGLLASWPENGPKVRWQVKIGEGYSAISVADGMVVTMFNAGDDEVVAAFDAATGAERWRLRTDAAYPSDQGGGPRSTPSIHGGRVFALGARGRLAAVDAATGTLLWKRDLAEQDGARAPQWGVSTDPIVIEGSLIVNAGGPKGKSVMAFDPANGSLRWTAGDDPAGYSTPIPINIGGSKQVVIFSARSISGFSTLTGKRLWSHPWTTDWDVHAAAPIFVPPNRIFFSSGYRTGAALLELSGDDRAGWKVKELWASRGLKNQFSSSVIVGGTIYGFDNRVFKAVDLATGEDRWKVSGLGHGSLLAADGKLIVLSERGELHLGLVDPKAWRSISSFSLFPGKTWTVPTLAHGTLYARDTSTLVALEVAAP